jgi:hypothetical protein
MRRSALEWVLEWFRGPRRTALIPAYQDLQPGDIILSRKRWRLFTWIAVGQWMLHGRAWRNSRWTHAMIYVGELHAVESNKFFRIGVRSVPLTRDRRSHDFLVLRSDHALTAVRAPIMVAYAKDRAFYYPPRYDLTPVWLPLLRWMERRPDHTRSISCGEFVLQCYFRGGFLPERYNELMKQGSRKFYLPPDFLGESGFQRFEMRYLELELPPS